jgi:hypothetical protein
MPTSRSRWTSNARGVRQASRPLPQYNRIQVVIEDEDEVAGGRSDILDVATRDAAILTRTG